MGAYGGVGDITLGATHLLRKGYKTLPDVVFTLSGGLPTGEKSLLSNATTGGLGTGYGSLGGQLIMIHTYDPFVFYWGGGCNFYFEGNIDGTPVKLGDSICSKSARLRNQRSRDDQQRSDRRLRRQNHGQQQHHPEHAARAVPLPLGGNPATLPEDHRTVRGNRPDDDVADRAHGGAWTF